MDNAVLDGLGWAVMGFHWLWLLVPLTVVIAAAKVLATALSGGVRRGSDGEADAILRRRLAAGEIDTEQFEQARAALGLADRA